MVSRYEDGPEEVLRGYIVQEDMVVVNHNTGTGIIIRAETDIETSQITNKSV